MWEEKKNPNPFFIYVTRWVQLDPWKLSQPLWKIDLWFLEGRMAELYSNGFTSQEVAMLDYAPLLPHTRAKLATLSESAIHVLNTAV